MILNSTGYIFGAVFLKYIYFYKRLIFMVINAYIMVES